MKFALVTGGSRGIGRAICLKMADMGYNILINYKSNEIEANHTLSLVMGKGVSGEIIQLMFPTGTRCNQHWVAGWKPTRIRLSRY